MKPPSRGLVLGAVGVGAVAGMSARVPMHVVIVSLALIAVMLCSVRYRPLRNVDWAVLVPAGLVFSVVALWAAVLDDASDRLTDGKMPERPPPVTGEASSSSAPRGLTNTPNPERTDGTAVSFGPRRSIGVRPRTLASATNGLWTTTDSGLAVLDPAEEPPNPDTIAMSSQPDEIAAEGSRLVAIRGGRATFYDTETRKRIGRGGYTFGNAEGEAAGQAAMSGGFAWICNRAASKVLRIDPRTKARSKINVPGKPNGIVARDGNLYVTLEEGYVVRLRPNSRRLSDGVTVSPTPAMQLRRKSPGGLAVDERWIWVSHPDDRVIVRIRRGSGRQVGAPIDVAPDIVELVVHGRYVWAISTSGDVVERIDRTSGRIISTKVPAKAPAGLAVFENELYYTSAIDGDIVRIDG